tara:strand:+ start:634 stop:1731 length:1098 start_codon:yes stop_codon:yes gene_type:complete
MNKITFFRLGIQHSILKKEIDLAIQGVFTRDHFVLGPECEAFEKEFAAYTGTRFAVGVASGTDAITLALMAVGVEPGDEVITVSNTATPTAIGISRAGLTPVFADIEKDGYQIDPEDLEKRITSKTKAILPVHLYGQPVDMGSIMDISGRLGIPVIEDACQAHGACYNSKRVGGIGLLGCFSFYPTKNLGCLGDGGMITLNEEALYNKLLLLRNYGQISKYKHVEIGLNSRLDELQAAVLRVKLKYLDKWNRDRTLISEYYSKNIMNPEIIKPRNLSGRESVYHIYPVRCRDRDALRDWLEFGGVQTLIHYPEPIHMQAPYALSQNLELSRSEDHAKSVLSLPVYPELPFEDVERICERINQFRL